MFFIDKTDTRTSFSTFLLGAFLQRDVVVHEHLVRVLQQVLHTQRGVVRLDQDVGNARGGHHAERLHDALAALVQVVVPVQLIKIYEIGERYTLGRAIIFLKVKVGIAIDDGEAS